jgi:hypothetical protein
MSVVKGEDMAWGLALFFSFNSGRILGSMEKDDWEMDVFRAFSYVGMTRAVFGDFFDEFRQNTYEKAKEKLISIDAFQEDKFIRAVEDGLEYGELIHLPKKISKRIIQPSFVAGLASIWLRDQICYVEGDGWYILKDGYWRRWHQQENFGIAGPIRRVIECEIERWREAIEAINAEHDDVDDGYIKRRLRDIKRYMNSLAEWMKTLEVKIKELAWVRKAENLLLQVKYFGIPRLSETPKPLASGNDMVRSPVAKDDSFLSHALGYGKLGYRVFPLKPGTEEPLIPDWQEKATWEETQIREWWGRWPNANIGIATGQCRDGYFVVLDYDPRKGGDWEKHLSAGMPSSTWIVKTPYGGRHFYYKTSEPMPSAKLKPGVYLRGIGDYVVAPPSWVRFA